MKKITNPGWGVAPILALFAFTAIHVSSCDGSNSGTRIVPDAQATTVVNLTTDSVVVGNPTGTNPKYIKLYCPTNDCTLLDIGSNPTSTGTTSTAYVLEATTADAIPANTTIRVLIRMKKGAMIPMADTAMTK